MAKLPPRIVTVDELVAKSVFEKEFEKLKKELETQQSITWQVVMGVGIAFVIAVGIIVTEVTLARDAYTNDTSTMEKEINGQAIQLNDLKNQIGNIKTLNPYLK